MGEQLNINIKTTAAEPLRSNGIVEKHNGIFENMMENVLLDVKCSLDVAMAWCLSAKILCLTHMDTVLWSQSQLSISLEQSITR